MGSTTHVAQVENSNGIVSFFESYCLLKGLDPSKERAAMNARCHRISHLSFLQSRDASMPGKSPEAHTSQRGHKTESVTDQGEGKLTLTFASKEELRAYLVDLLMEDIIEICLGATKGKKS